MKNLILLTLIISSQTFFSQIGVGLNSSPNSFYESLYFKNNKYEYKDIKGSPYENTDFQLAQIGDYRDIPVRYNSYTDSFEFKQDGKNYILPKEDNLSRVVFQNRKKTYVLLNLEGSKQYLEELSSDVGLYKKNTTAFREFKKATTNYEQDYPPTFEQLAPKYYGSIDGNLVEISKKSVEKNFSKQQKDLKDYMRKNNLNYEKEQDLIKILSFLKSNK
ncbi:hypothetical protein K0U91_04890 [Chryseobacterium chendengshani]|uniref:hypothetical protein n=1 Tax=Chryseobacterium sp. LJ668 TaxID=2864040 RepID=UPI001C693D42|nr:hypothetical protein [Chryseobacterium sp. LJ668]MBW8521801.1 hypothetical protein [Chryseobacterium sp. LJ668]QYK17463.1 hypothetical protein K0U91_04890 [Chryseobacterium sp. LJ668]